MVLDGLVLRHAHARLLDGHAAEALGGLEGSLGHGDADEVDLVLVQPRERLLGPLRLGDQVPRLLHGLEVVAERFRHIRPPGYWKAMGFATTEATASSKAAQAARQALCVPTRRALELLVSVLRA